MDTIKIIKQIDQFIGPVLLKLFPRAVMAKPKATRIKKILVIRPGGMGDALLLLPILKEITSLFHIKIDILCEPRNKTIFKSVTFLNHIFSYKSLKSMVSVFQNQYDAVFDTEQSHFLSAIITRLVNADIKAGFKTKGREKMYNKTMAYSHHIYEAKMFRELFSIVFSLRKPFHFHFPYFNISARSKQLDLPKGNIVCLFPGASIDERLWPERRWVEVIDWLRNNNFLPILIGGKKEYNQCQNISKNCRENPFNLCGKLSILDTAQLFKKISLLISTDSGILHLGVLSDIPTISLFGPGIAPKWAPKGMNHIVINKKIACSPCTLFGTTPPCPNKNECMLKIIPEDIILKIVMQ